MFPPDFLPPLQPLRDFLPSLFALLLAYPLLRLLITTFDIATNSDLFRIPEPPVPLWRRFLTGHNTAFIVTAADSFHAARQLQQWRLRHGPIFRLTSLFGMRSVVVTSEHAIRTVFVRKSSFIGKTPASIGFLTPFVGNDGILVADGERHVKLRRAVAPAMHHEALMSVARIFLAEGRALAERLACGGDRPVDVLHEVRVATFEVIFQTCFGDDALSEAEHVRLRDAYLEVFLEPPLYMLLSFLARQVFWFVDPFVFTYRKGLKRFMREVVRRLCEDRMGGGVGGGTRLLSLMVDAETNKKMTPGELVGTVLSFLAAGQATTSMSVSWTVYTLGREREWQERVAKELEGWCEEDGLEKLDRLPVLDRVVRESFRLYPPLALLVRLVKEDLEVEGYKLRKGTVLRLPVLAIQRDPAIWGADAEEFNPDRFLSAEYVARTRMFWCGFSFGPRNCIGQRFALLEIKAFIAQLVKRQEIYVKASDPEPTCRGAFTTPRNMKVYFRDRKVE